MYHPQATSTFIQDGKTSHCPVEVNKSVGKYILVARSFIPRTFYLKIEKSLGSSRADAKHEIKLQSSLQ